MDLISLPTEFDKKKIDSRYRLVIAASIRARQLMSRTAMPKIESKSKKDTTKALEEILTEAVKVLTGEAAMAAIEKAKSLIPEHIMMDEAKQKETLPEDLTELEKDLKVYLHEKGEGKRSIDDIFKEEGKE
ncbi:MAG: DNA-directed RNA polymerase subunit omega [Nitrospirae bacterium]|nr:DNA-directed RNA polymerase subunit omega [Nitrospirota bacterium]